DAHAGYLFTAQFIGSTTAAACSGPLTARIGLRKSLCLGFVVMSAGLAALTFSGYLTGLLSVFLFGLGLGTTIPSTNLLVAGWHPDRKAAALNLLNFSWCIGAVASPPLIGSAIDAGRSNQALAVVSLFAICTSGWIYRLGGADARSAEMPVDEASRQVSGVWRDSIVVGIGAVVFLYVGAETSIGGWISSYSSRLSGAS